MSQTNRLQAKVLNLLVVLAMVISLSVLVVSPVAAQEEFNPTPEYSGCHLDVAVNTYIKTEAGDFIPEDSFSPGECFYVNAVVGNDGNGTAVGPITATISWSDWGQADSALILASGEGNCTKTWAGDLTGSSPPGLNPMADFWWKVCCTSPNGPNQIRVDVTAAQSCDQTFPVSGYTWVYQMPIAVPPCLQIEIVEAPGMGNKTGHLGNYTQTMPGVVNPCTNFGIKAEITNNCDTTLYNANATIEVWGPASIVGNDPNTWSIGDLAAGETKAVAWTLHCDAPGDVGVHVKASSNGQSLDASTDFIDNPWIVHQTTQGWNAHLIGGIFFFIQDGNGIMTEHDAVVPGTYFHVVIPVINSGDADAESVEVYFTITDGPEAPCTKSYEFISASGDGSVSFNQQTGIGIATLGDIPGHSMKKATLLLHCICAGYVSVWIPEVMPTSAGWGIVKGIRGYDADTGEAIPQDNIVIPPCPEVIEQVPFTVAIENPYTCQTFEPGSIFIVKALVSNSSYFDFEDVSATVSWVGNAELVQPQDQTKSLGNLPASSQAEVTWEMQCTASGEVYISVSATLTNPALTAPSGVVNIHGVYNPAGGFVTGGGWIKSPAGAYTANPQLTGKANFGFDSKYQKGATVPTGNTEFQFQVGNLNFHSTSYQWLVVAGSRAQYKGYGTINGKGNYGFMLTAIDGQVNGGGGIDKFRIKIWDKATNTIIYDNQQGAPDTANPTTAIAGGSIVIHK